MYVARTLEAHLLAASHHFPVVLLTGARQVGKTMLLRHLSQPDREYVTLDDPLVLQLARSDPALFLQRFPPLVLIDEIQDAPGLLPYITLAADRAGATGLFWLTSSQQFHLMQGVSASLAGRAAVLQLHGLSHWERIGRGLESTPFVPTPSELIRRAYSSPPLTLKEIYRLIWRGSLPAIALNDAVERDLFYGSYVQICLCEQCLPLTETVWAIPAWVV